MTQFTIGCDPEIFLVDGEGKPLSAHGIIKGTKKEPFKIDNGAYQVDGMAVEFNTDPVPIASFQAFNANVVSVLRRLKKDVEAANPDAKFNIAPVQIFGKEFIDNQPDDAKELGCDPDFCAYTGEANPRPDGDRDFRTAAGHIHIGWGSGIPADHPDHFKICCDFVKMLDATVGLVMTYIDTDPRRRELYGKAGAFRPKPYGVEYRTPSNQWLLDVAYRRVVHYACNKAVTLMRSYGSADSFLRKAANITPEHIRSIIDNGQIHEAKAYIDHFVVSRFENSWHDLELARSRLLPKADAVKKVNKNV